MGLDAVDGAVAADHVPSRRGCAPGDPPRDGPRHRQPRPRRGEPVRGERDVEVRGDSRAHPDRADDHRAARERRPGRHETHREEDEARLQPPQPLQGNQEDGRHADVVGARQGPRQDRPAARGRVAGIQRRNDASDPGQRIERVCHRGLHRGNRAHGAAQRVGRRAGRRGRRLRVPEAPREQRICA